jgi:hypothetical protein
LPQQGTQPVPPPEKTEKEKPARSKARPSDGLGGLYDKLI